MTTKEKILQYMILSIIPGFGVVSQNRLLKMCGSLEACYGMPEEELMRRHRSAEKELRIGENRLQTFFRNRDAKELEKKALEIMNKCRKGDVEIITPEDKRYPDRFRNVSHMPVILYVKGNLKINDYSCSTGIVGARRCSAEGKQLAIAIAEEKMKNHSVIVSGMAKGIDSYAHTAALKNNGYTIAVLGSGADICYPTEHRRLYEEIALCGCIFSEYPPGTRPANYMFPERNRLIAALSDELIVIEAGQRSGTESTAAYCRQYGRKIMRVSPVATV